MSHAYCFLERDDLHNVTDGHWGLEMELTNTTFMYPGIRTASQVSDHTNSRKPSGPIEHGSTPRPRVSRQVDLRDLPRWQALAFFGRVQGPFPSCSVQMPSRRPIDLQAIITLQDISSTMWLYSLGPRFDRITYGVALPAWYLLGCIGRLRVQAATCSEISTYAVTSQSSIKLQSYWKASAPR